MPRMRQLKINKQVTNRDTPSLDKYLTEIGKVKLITAVQEVELAVRIKQGDENALKELCKANLRFVVSVAKQYQGQGLTLPDLISEGNLGLIKAAKRFDETRGFKFISYAVWWIRQQILQSLAEQARIVRLPLNRSASMNRIKKATAKLEQEYEREPSVEELAELMDVSHEEIASGLGNMGRHLSMDAPIHSEGTATMHDVMESSSILSTEETISYRDLKDEIERILDTLTEREADTIRLYYGLKGKTPHTLEEIGQKFDLTRERVRQVREKAIRKMRTRTRSEALRAYLN